MVIELFFRRVEVRNIRLSFFLIASLLAGCAQVTAVPVTPDNPHPDGLPFYGHKPILIVSSQGATVEIIPNLNERYALQMHSFLAKNHSKLVLGSNGTLTSMDSNLDATSIISFFEKALDKIPTDDTASAPALAAQGNVKVYEFVFQPNGMLSLKEILHSELEYKPGSGASTNEEPGSASGGVAPICEEQ